MRAEGSWARTTRPVHPLKRSEDEIDAFLQRDPEAGHAGVGDGQFGDAIRHELLKERDHRTPGADDIAVADHGVAGRLLADGVVGGHEQLVWRAASSPHRG